MDGAPSIDNRGDRRAFRFMSQWSLAVPEDLVDSAWLEHAAFAFWLVHALAPRKLVELGTHHGYSYFVVCQTVKAMNFDTACYAVDTWKGDEHAAFYDESVYAAVQSRNEKYASFSTLMKTTFDEAAEYFPDKSIDLLHIDGRHFYEDVKSDFERWRPKLSDRAIVLFHDTNVRERDFGVWRLFRELKSSYRTFEFMHAHGLGILAIGDTVAPVSDLLSIDEQEAATVRDLYAQLGNNLRVRWQAQQTESRLSEMKKHIDKLTEQFDLLSAYAEKTRAKLEATIGSNERLLKEVRKQTILHERGQAAEAALMTIQSSERLRVSRTLERLSLIDRGNRLAQWFDNRQRTSDERDAEIASKIRSTQLFDEPYYRAHNPDVVLRGIDPAVHFAREGWQQGRRPNAHFDPAFYLAQNPDVAKTGINPLVHFSEGGWKEGRKPSPLFDPAFYLRQHQDIATSGVNPLVHYLQDGYAEGRVALPQAHEASGHVKS